MHYHDMNARRLLLRRCFDGMNRFDNRSEDEMNEQGQCESACENSAAGSRHARAMRERIAL